VTVTTQAGALFSWDADVLGSARMRVSGTNMCTSGFNVTQSGTGTTGLTSAGHCTNQNQVLDESGGVVSTSPQAEHLGTYGDFEWHTTAGAEPPEFFAQASETRSVRSVKTTWYRNQPVCVYGRTTNARICDLIFRTSVNQVLANGATGKKLVMTKARNSTGGDSGGTWSLGNQAIGIHTGGTLFAFKGAQRDVFSRASRLPGALGVSVTTDP
jgi:hypothetical protein